MRPARWRWRSRRGLTTNECRIWWRPRSPRKQDFDKAVETLQVAEADVKRSQAAIAEAESQVVTAEKNLAYQKERLTYTQILSPYDGLVVRRDRDPGGVVVPGGSLLQLISTNEIWVSAWVDETAMSGPCHRPARAGGLSLRTGDELSGRGCAPGPRD